MDIVLPGGTLRDGRLHRHAVLRELTGALELRLAGHLAGKRSWPDCVTDMLAEAVRECAGGPVDRGRVAGLCVADRQVLLLHLLAELEGDVFWLSADCPACSERFDLGVQRSQIPVKPAGEGFPFCDVRVGEQSMRLRVPTGADQAAIAALSPAHARRGLLQRCTLDGDVPFDVSAVVGDPAALQAVESALETVSPELASELLTVCPHCGHEQTVACDACAFSADSFDAVYDDVHSLASRYHWSEREILELPRWRRRLYLALIERSPTPVQ